MAPGVLGGSCGLRLDATSPLNRLLPGSSQIVAAGRSSLDVDRALLLPRLRLQPHDQGRLPTLRPLRPLHALSFRLTRLVATSTEPFYAVLSRVWVDLYRALIQMGLSGLCSVQE